MLGKFKVAGSAKHSSMALNRDAERAAPKNKNGVKMLSFMIQLASIDPDTSLYYSYFLTSLVILLNATVNP